MDKLNGLEAVMQEHATATYPHEACGLIVAAGTKPRFIACKNIAEDPSNYFRLDPHDYINASDEGEIVGVWHTHVNMPATPSEADIAGCNASSVDWFILGASKIDGTMHFTPVATLRPGDAEAPYLERVYLFGVQDCYTLVRDYYRREFDITLGEYPRVESFWNKSLDFFTGGYPEQGFELLIDQEPEVGDLFIMQVAAPLPNHIAIYVGDDLILHHCQSRLSRRDVYGGMWAKHTTHHLRHKSKCLQH